MPGIMSNQPCFRQGTHPLLQLSHMLYLQSAINDLISLGPRCLSVSVSRTGPGNLHLRRISLVHVWGIYKESKHFLNTSRFRGCYPRVLSCNLRWGLCCQTVMYLLIKWMHEWPVLFSLSLSLSFFFTIDESTTIYQQFKSLDFQSPMRCL